MKTYKLICMSFDGEYKVTSPVFDSVESAWRFSNDLGSTWYFYPFHFVVTESAKTIAASPHGLERFDGQRVATVAKVFAALAGTPEAQNKDVEWFGAELQFA